MRAQQSSMYYVYLVSGFIENIARIRAKAFLKLTYVQLLILRPHGVGMVERRCCLYTPHTPHRARRCRHHC
ncbi:hypothetical protein Hanom_Chr08g00698481 [Helianthus anomalus]